MSMASDPIRNPVVLTAEPVLFVADIQASCDFFTRQLGFALAFVYGDPPFYAQVKRGGAALNLKLVDRPVIERELRDREDLLSATITVESAGGLDRLASDFQSARVAFHRPLTRQPWGAVTFIVKDPDGNLLLFAAPAE